MNTAITACALRCRTRYLVVWVVMAMLASACGNDRVDPTLESAAPFDRIDTRFLHGSEIDSSDDPTTITSLDGLYDHMWATYGMSRDDVDMNLAVASKARDLVSTVESSDDLSAQLGGAWLQWSETDVVLRLTFIEPYRVLDQVRALASEAGLGREQVLVNEAPVTIDYLRSLQGDISSILGANEVEGWSGWIDQERQQAIVMGPDTTQIRRLIAEQINQHVVVMEGMFGLTDATITPDEHVP